MALIVKGNLQVEGELTDNCDPYTVTLVLGNLEAKGVRTAGDLEVLGSLRASGWLIGFYNDYSAMIAGDVSAPVFVPEYHYFDIRGKAQFGLVLGERAADRVPEAVGPSVRPLDPARYREVMVPEVVIPDDEIPMEEALEMERNGDDIRWILDMERVEDRLRKGLRLTVEGAADPLTSRLASEIGE
jgi:hypothetical protein